MPSNDRTPERPYVVGRGKPPVEHQFKKGQSGNPRGRPKASSIFSEEIERQFDRMVTIEQNGRRYSVQLRVQIIRGLMQRCLKGEIAALRVYLRLMKKFEPPSGLKRKRPLVIKIVEPMPETQQKISLPRADDS